MGYEKLVVIRFKTQNRMYSGAPLYPLDDLKNNPRIYLNGEMFEIRHSGMVANQLYLYVDDASPVTAGMGYGYQLI